MEQPKEFDMMLSYDDVADYVFEGLVDLGYVPESDEVLDIADLFFDFILQFMANSGVQVLLMVEDEEEDDE